MRSISFRSLHPPEVAGAIPVLSLQVTITDNSVAVTQFAVPLTITESYDPLALNAVGIDPANLHIYLVDTTGATTQLQTTVTTANNTVSAAIPHLSSIILAGPATEVGTPLPNHIFLPNIDSSAPASW